MSLPDASLAAGALITSACFESDFAGSALPFSELAAGAGVPKLKEGVDLAAGADEDEGAGVAAAGSFFSDEACSVNGSLFLGSDGLQNVKEFGSGNALSLASLSLTSSTLASSPLTVSLPSPGSSVFGSSLSPSALLSLKSSSSLATSLSSALSLSLSSLSFVSAAVASALLPVAGLATAAAGAKLELGVAGCEG